MRPHYCFEMCYLRITEIGSSYDDRMIAVCVRERNWKKSTNDPSKGLLVTQSERDIDLRRLIQNIFNNLNLVIVQ